MFRDHAIRKRYSKEYARKGLSAESLRKENMNRIYRKKIQEHNTTFLTPIYDPTRRHIPGFPMTYKLTVDVVRSMSRTKGVLLINVLGFTVSDTAHLKAHPSQKQSEHFTADTRTGHSFLIREHN
jgi:hypothetical protein